MIHEAATDRIVVNVIDHRTKRGRFLDVAIISAASLPETIVDLPMGLGVPQTFEKRRGVAAKKGQGFSLHGYFEGRSNEPDFINRLPWPNDDMDVLRHNDVSPNQEIPPITGLVQGLDKPLPASVFAQQGQSPKARKGKLVGLAGGVIASAPFSMTVIHGGTVWMSVCMLSRPHHGFSEWIRTL